MTISFDYLIQRDEGDRITSFQPDGVPRALPNLCLIEGPNSSGKSTLLHLIAAGFFGSKLKNLDDGLRAKVESMVDPAYQGTTFSLEVASEDGKVQLKARKADPAKREILVEEHKGGKRRILSPELFEREYRLIYDIPDDPTRRMVQLIDEIDAVQRTYAGTVVAYRRRIEDVISEIQNGRNPKRLAELEDLVRSQRREVETWGAKQGAAHDAVTLLTRYRAVKALLEAHRELEKTEAERRKVRKVIKRDDRNRTAASAQSDALRAHLTEKCDALDRLHGPLGSVLDGLTRRKDKHKVEAWRRISFIHLPTTFEIDPNLMPLMADLRELVHAQKSSPAYGKDLERAKVFDRLQKILKEFVAFTEALPGTDKTISELIEALAEENQKNQQNLQLATHYEEASAHLQQMSDLLREVKNLLPQAKAAHAALRASGAHASDVDGEDEAVVERLEDRKKQLEHKVLQCEEACIKAGISLDDLPTAAEELDQTDALQPFRTYNEAELWEAIQAQGASRDAAEAKAKALSKLVQSNEIEVERLSNKQPHPYEDRLAELDAMRKACSRIEVNLSSRFQKYGKELRDRKPLAKEPEAEQYASAIGKYIAARLGAVRHVDGVYDVQHVDLVSGTLITREGRRIRLSDMGTGQSMSAYLVALLSVDDRRPVIALFDEVAMMDDKSLKPVFTKMRQMHGEGKLLAGLVVQRADKMTIRPI